MKRLFLKMAAVALAGTIVGACGGNDSGDDKTPGTLIDVASRGGFSGLVYAVTKAGLADTLRAPNADLTLLAPSNDAFALLAGQIGFPTIQAMADGLPPETLQAILLYHVLPGRITGADLLAGGSASLNTSLVQGGNTQTLALTTTNGIRVTDSVGRVGIVGLTDVPNDNGVFHVIDRVLLPPGLLTVLQTVRSNPERFSSLAGAIGDPALVTTLNGAGPFTLFAPTDDAFQAASPVLTTLASNQIDAVLKYHVVGARLLSSAFVFGAPVQTLAGQPFTINAGVAPVLATIDDTSATDGGVIGVDIIASNGVVHIINKVLMPTLPAPN
jgi:transforming growth factor-beta-induced protein